MKFLIVNLAKTEIRTASYNFITRFSDDYHLHSVHI